MSGLESGVVRLVECDARWPELFAAEDRRIRDQAGVLAMHLEHVGGTSIPHVWAKPILDMVAGRPPGTPARDYVAALKQAGYDHRGEQGVHGREFFHRVPQVFDWTDPRYGPALIRVDRSSMEVSATFFSSPVAWRL